MTTPQNFDESRTFFLKSIPATPRRMTGKPSSCLPVFSEVSLSSLPGIVTPLSEHARPGWPFLILL